jgi:hypothetical protein
MLLSKGSKSIPPQELPDVPGISMTTEMVSCFKNDEKLILKPDDRYKSWQYV